MIRSSIFAILLLSVPGFPRDHVIAYGQPLKVKLFTDVDDKQPMDIRIRSLSLDGKIR